MSMDSRLVAFLVTLGFFSISNASTFVKNLPNDQKEELVQKFEILKKDKRLFKIQNPNGVRIQYDYN